MDLSLQSERVRRLAKVLTDFVENECIPAEALYERQMGEGADRWKVIPPVMEKLKQRARELGLWNLFLPKEYPEGAGLTNLEYAPLCEIMGRSVTIAPEACNCAAPDTGNMEVFAKYGTPEQKKRWLQPLLEGKIRSAFAMTEPAVASSDATNIETAIRPSPDGQSYTVTGRKWWISGAGDPRCEVFLVMGMSAPKHNNIHKRQSIVIVPRNAPGVKVVRPLMVFGYDDAPIGHCELVFDNVVVPKENLILGEGRGFEVIQGRLGPGRIHHCMRAIGMAERALDTMLLRVTERRAFGKLLSEQGTILADIAKSRMELDQARQLVLKAADMIDRVGAKHALKEIAMVKVVVPSMALRVVDRAIQAHGGAGVHEDLPLARMWAGLRTLRLADGPDEVHTMQIGKLELRRVKELRAHREKQRSLAAKL
ncbi:acyl-CoA dehydrogenase/oxidase [Thamnocephalis sphaerospora]|uniref:Acyl-CoA dehydrogenase/oxidase n=1 Tax=Thamnocephalis sphaerospora TaxID=78915 RepID=A0A4P9XI30_9FUNG|nr:acyl-CoA dehydrogenase/oxidase [Thamnocephalis sphaerospora]|eukprot:RKP04971.1 acyl-CoA dehydrogenase/oxidase [Thamnocephalis sphaerospora]